MHVTLFAVEVRPMDTNGAPTDKPARRILRTPCLGALAAALAVVFDYGPGIHGLPRMAVLLAGFFLLVVALRKFQRSLDVLERCSPLRKEL